MSLTCRALRSPKATLLSYLPQAMSSQTLPYVILAYYNKLHQSLLKLTA